MMSAALRPRVVPRSAGQFGRVVLAVDFSPASLAAARWAMPLFAPDARSVAAHVVPLANAGEFDAAQHEEKAHALSLMTPAIVGGLGGFAATLPTRPRAVARVGSESRVLVEIADDVDADLVVMGRRRNRRGRAVREPNVVERVARRVWCAVLVVPHGTERPPVNVGVAIDGGRQSSRLVQLSWRLAESLGARLTMLHVLPEEYPPGDDYAEMMGWARDAGEEPKSAVLAWLATLLVPHGGVAGVDVASGEPTGELMRMVQEANLDLLVVGKQGADDSPPGSLGSVARHLLARSNCPVLAVE
jgi:nucleotide-binding universal stress UspA family protein